MEIITKKTIPKYKTDYESTLGSNKLYENKDIDIFLEREVDKLYNDDIIKKQIIEKHKEYIGKSNSDNTFLYCK